MSITIGQRGRADTPMSPQGKVTIGGRQFDARADGRWIDAGAEVIVVQGDHLGLIVMPAELGVEPKTLPGFGEPLKIAAWHKSRAQSSAQIERERRKEARLRSIERRVGLHIAIVAGGLAGMITVLIGFGSDEAANGELSYTSLVSACVVVGLSWGAILFSTIYHGILDGRRDFGKLIYVVLFLGLGGGVAGALFGYHTWGLREGVVWAFLGSLILGSLVPVIVIVLQVVGEPEVAEGGE